MMGWSRNRFDTIQTITCWIAPEYQESVRTAKVAAEFSTHRRNGYLPHPRSLRGS